MDITPLINSETKIINKYGEGKLTINNIFYQSNLMIVDNKIIEFAPEITILEILESFKKHNIQTRILLIGSGNIVDLKLKLIMSKMMPNINTEIMSISAAVSTYNILIAEDRKVSAVFCWHLGS